MSILAEFLTLPMAIHGDVLDISEIWHQSGSTVNKTEEQSYCNLPINQELRTNRQNDFEKRRFIQKFKEFILNFYKTTNWCAFFFSVTGWAWWSQRTISKRKAKNLKWEDFVQCYNCCLTLPPLVDRCIKVLLRSSALLNSHLITRVNYSAFTLSPLGTPWLKAKERWDYILVMFYTTGRRNCIKTTQWENIIIK